MYVAVRGHDLRHPAQREVAAGRVTDDIRLDPLGPRVRARPTSQRHGATMEVVVVTGLSGGGKTAAAKLFEDLGYVVVDNLPGRAPARPRRPDRDATRAVRRTAIVIDVRAGDIPLAFGAMRGALEGRGIRPGDHLPRGARRRPHPAVQRDPPPAPARRRAGDRDLDRARAGDARLRPRRRPTSSSTRATCRCASCGSGSSPASATSSARTGWRSSSSASGSSTACRSRRTSCSTSGS